MVASRMSCGAPSTVSFTCPTCSREGEGSVCQKAVGTHAAVGLGLRRGELGEDKGARRRAFSRIHSPAPMARSWAAAAVSVTGSVILPAVSRACSRTRRSP